MNPYRIKAILSGYTSNQVKQRDDQGKVTWLQVESYKGGFKDYRIGDIIFLNYRICDSINVGWQRDEVELISYEEYFHVL